MSRIVIDMEPSGQPGQYTPTIHLEGVPGGWPLAIDVLLTAARLAHHEHLRSLQGAAAPRVQLATTMPPLAG